VIALKFIIVVIQKTSCPDNLLFPADLGLKSVSSYCLLLRELSVSDCYQVSMLAKFESS
jgi:hypothetical protein